MYTKQISVYLENVRGTLRNVTRLIGEAGVDIMALSVADTASFGIVRIIVREEDIDKTVRLLKEAGCTVRVDDVVCVCVSNCPAGLDKVLEIIEQIGVSVEYMYSFNYNAGDEALLIFRLSDKEAGVKGLIGSGIRIFTQKEVNAL